MKLSFHGLVKNSKFAPDLPEEFSRSFQEYEGKRVTVVVGKEFKLRSDKENRYYWGVVVDMIASYIGETKDITHEILKALFLKETIYTSVKGKMKHFDIIKSTTELSTAEFEEFTENSRRWAAEFFEIIIPDPNQVTS